MENLRAKLDKSVQWSNPLASIEVGYKKLEKNEPLPNGLSHHHGFANDSYQLITILSESFGKMMEGQVMVV